MLGAFSPATGCAHARVVGASTASSSPLSLAAAAARRAGSAGASSSARALLPPAAVAAASPSPLAAVGAAGAAGAAPARGATTIANAAAANSSSSKRKPVIAITGATGLVGSRLAARLAALGVEVRVLTTRPVAQAKAKLPYPGLSFHARKDWPSAVCGADAVVNLAGTPIGTRWTAEIKRELKSSRLGVTNDLVDAMERCSADEEGSKNARPKVLVSASAVGFYGTSESATFTEDSPSGSDYLSEICRDWEAAALRAEQSGVRVVVLRTGIVLAPEGGVIAKMRPVFDLFAGGPLGTGRQLVSWIHRDDLVELIINAVRDERYSGAYNATAPRPVTMADLCASVGKAIGRPSWLPVPDFALTTLLGEGAQVVLSGQRVLPQRALSQGFSFKYGDLDAAVRQVVGQ